MPLNRANPPKSGQRLGLLLPALAAGLGLCAGHAFGKAENPADKQLSITTRTNPAYDPQGFRLADFVISPSITTSTRYNDNIYATELSREHDFIFSVKPDLRIQSDFTRHSLEMGFSLEDGKYRDISAEDYTDYTLYAGGRIDVSGQTAIPLRISYARDHVRRGGPDERTAQEPTVFHLWESTMGIVHEGQRIAGKILAGFKRYVYDDVLGAGGTIDNGDRDLNEYSLYTSLGMNPETIFAPFVYGSVTKINYDRTFDNNGFNRDAMQYEAGLGTIVNFSNITSASFTVGRLQRRSDDPALKDIGDFTYGLNVKWEPSPLASFLLSGDRTIQESTLSGVTGSVASSLRLTMNYELFPNVIVIPSAGLVERDYQGPSGGRTLTTESNLQLTYKMNQNFWLSTSYQYTNQEEKETGAGLESYENNQLGVAMTLQF